MAFLQNSCAFLLVVLAAVFVQGSQGKCSDCFIGNYWLFAVTLKLSFPDARQAVHFFSVCLQLATWLGDAGATTRWTSSEATSHISPSGRSIQDVTASSCSKFQLQCLCFLCLVWHLGAVCDRQQLLCGISASRCTTGRSRSASGPRGSWARLSSDAGKGQFHQILAEAVRKWWDHLAGTALSRLLHAEKM